MSKPTAPAMPKWPFFVGDAVLLALACFVCAQRGRSGLDDLQVTLVILAAAAGATLAVVPFVLEYRAAARLVESSGIVATVADELQNLEIIAAQINAATARWQVVQEHSANSVTAAREVAGKMSSEAAAFREFLQKANDNERSTLRLEVEKFRRMEGEWLQVVVRLLDHTYALYRAAERSGQRTLVDQMGLFQNSCRDTARRMGLVPVVPAVNDHFDPQVHQVPEAHPKPAIGAPIGDILATGFTYQGRLIRPAMVILRQASDKNDDVDVDSPNGSAVSEEATGLA